MSPSTHNCRVQCLTCSLDISTRRNTDTPRFGLEISNVCFDAFIVSGPPGQLIWGSACYACYRAFFDEFGGWCCLLPSIMVSFRWFSLMSRLTAVRSKAVTERIVERYIFRFAWSWYLLTLYEMLCSNADPNCTREKHIGCYIHVCRSMPHGIVPSAQASCNLQWHVL